MRTIQNHLVLDPEVQVMNPMMMMKRIMRVTLMNMKVHPVLMMMKILVLKVRMRMKKKMRMEMRMKMKMRQTYPYPDLKKITMFLKILQKMKVF